MMDFLFSIMIRIERKKKLILSRITLPLSAVVVAQLVERSLPTPEVRGSNPDIGKVLSTNCTLEKTKIKKKRPGMAHLL